MQKKFTPVEISGSSSDCKFKMKRSAAKLKRLKPHYDNLKASVVNDKGAMRADFILNASCKTNNALSAYLESGSKESHKILMALLKQDLKRLIKINNEAKDQLRLIKKEVAA